jgi:hypothetical protein
MQEQRRWWIQRRFGTALSDLLNCGLSDDLTILSKRIQDVLKLGFCWTLSLNVANESRWRSSFGELTRQIYQLEIISIIIIGSVQRLLVSKILKPPLLYYITTFVSALICFWLSHSAFGFVGHCIRPAVVVRRAMVACISLRRSGADDLRYWIYSGSSGPVTSSLPLHRYIPHLACIVALWQL